MYDVLKFVSEEKEPVKNWEHVRELNGIHFHRVGDVTHLTVGELVIRVSKTQIVVYGKDTDKDNINFKVPAGACIELNRDSIRFYQTGNFYEEVAFATEQSAKTVFIDITINSEV